MSSVLFDLFLKEDMPVALLTGLDDEAKKKVVAFMLDSIECKIDRSGGNGIATEMIARLHGANTKDVSLDATSLKDLSYAVHVLARLYALRGSGLIDRIKDALWTARLSLTFLCGKRYTSGSALPTPDPTVLYVNAYVGATGLWLSDTHTSRFEADVAHFEYTTDDQVKADMRRVPKRVACIRVDVKEGRFDA